MKNHQFPKEITAFEITAIDTVFIQKLRKQYLLNEANEGQPLTAEQYLDEILILIPERGISEFSLNVPKNDFNFELINWRRITEYFIKHNLESL